jgi:hypothetical protein
MVDRELLFTLRVSAEEREKLAALAEAAGVTSADWLRARIREAVLPVRGRSIVDIVRAHLEPSGLGWVPSVARDYGPGAIEALLQADAAGQLELRPDNPRMSPADRELCPKGFEGVLLPWVRIR